MNDDGHLHILWVSGEAVTAEKMVFMYAVNALKRQWWKQVSLIIWGASAMLTAENPQIQAKIKEAREQGVELIACKACADQLGVSEKLTALGVTVIYTGELLTDILKSKRTLLTV